MKVGSVLAQIGRPQRTVDASAVSGARELTHEEYAYLRKCWEEDKAKHNPDGFMSHTKLVVQNGCLLNVSANVWAFDALQARDIKIENDGWFRKVQSRVRPGPVAR